MSTRACVANRILELCGQQNMVINALSRISTMQPSTVKNIVNGVSRNLVVVPLKMLCDGLDITLSEFFDAAKFRGLEPMRDGPFV